MDATNFTHHDFGLEQVLEILSAERFTVAPTVEVTRTILDTFDGRLHEAELQLEAVTFTSPSGIDLILTSNDSIPATLRVSTIPRFVDILPTGPFRARLAPIVESRALLPLMSFTERTTSAVARDRSGKIVAFANVHQPVGGAAVPWTVEIIELPSHEKQAHEIRSALIARGFDRLADDIVQLMLANEHIDPAGFVSSPSVPLSPHMPAIEGFRDVLANLLATARANLPGTIDDVDSEFLHEFHVALRRTRSVLGDSKDVIPEPIRERFREEFRWLARATGPARDLDVYVLEWGDYVRDLSDDTKATLEPVLLHLRKHREGLHSELSELLQSDRAQTLLTSWDETLRHLSGTEDSPLAYDRLGSVITRRLKSAYKTVDKDGRAISDDTPAEALHDLRKDAKKLRYLIECFGVLLPKPDRKSFVQHLKGLQDNLGEHQDAEVHASELGTIAPRLLAEHASAETLMALGKLTEHLERGKQAARAEFAERFEDFNSKDTRHALDRMLQAMEQD